MRSLHSISFFKPLSLLCCMLGVVAGCAQGEGVVTPAKTQEGPEYRYPEQESSAATASRPQAVEEDEEEPVAPVRKVATRDKPELYDVMSGQGGVQVDDSLSSVTVRVPAALANTAWPQRGGDAANAVGNLKGGSWKSHDAASIGEGRAWQTILVSAPVVAGQTVYSMDAAGYISAHDAANIDKVHWVSPVAAPGNDKEILGGGLAVASGRVFASTGQGKVFSLSGKDGARLWERDLGVPIRSAPKLANSLLYITTIDDQLFALNGLNGQIVWQHRGLGERVGFLTAISPAISDGQVVVAYGSGEIYGLAADNGQEIWNDSLAQIQKTVATSAFTGFAADPVIVRGVAYTASAGSLTAATHLYSGSRLWDKEVSGGGTPWVAGEFIYQLTNDARLVALHAEEGGIKWIANLPRYADEERSMDPYSWYGPLMVNGELFVFGAHGEYRVFSPEDGALLRKESITEKIATLPVVAGGVLYYVTQDAKLHALHE